LFGWVLNRSGLSADINRLGRWAERYSCRLLRRKGLRPLAHNWRCTGGEIDLVMSDRDGTIVFVEVRSRSNERLIRPEASVTAGKKARLLHAARQFLAEHRLADRPVRFDLLTIVLGRKGRPQVQHYRNAFVPSE